MQRFPKGAKKHSQPTIKLGVRLFIPLHEKVKQAAQKASAERGRHVPMDEIVREWVAERIKKTKAA